MSEKHAHDPEKCLYCENGLQHEHDYPPVSSTVPMLGTVEDNEVPVNLAQLASRVVQLQEQLTMKERQRSPEKDMDVFKALHGMLAQLEWLMDRNELPYANDLWMSLSKVCQRIDDAMQSCNICDDE